MKPLSIGIIGFGNVGGGVGKILFDESQKSTSFPISIKKIAVQEISKTDLLGLPVSLFTENFYEILEDPSLDVIVELVGGTTIAKTIIETSLKNKKHVVTANKALIAEFGNELFTIAKENNVSLSFEASVGGGVPIIRTLQSHYFVGKIEKVFGIVNGTCNFILSEIEASGRSYQEILKEAQEKGFAEKDPTFDVEGYDAAQKLAILTHLSFGVSIPNWKSINITGISNLQSFDFIFAKTIKKKIRLVAMAEKNSKTSEIFLSVAPVLVKENSTLGNIIGPTNIITIKHEYLGEIALSGAGAGRFPTAVSVISDIFALFSSPSSLIDSSVNPFIQTTLPDSQKPLYFRFFVKDEVGVLAKVTEVFGRNNVSISEVRNAHGQIDPLCILTHSVSYDKKGILQKELSDLNVVIGDVSCFEVLE